MGDSYIELSQYFKKPEFSFYDFSACLAALILVVIVAKVIQNKNYRNPVYRKYFLSGLFIKMAGGLGYALVYTYYYTYGGDTSGYWKFGSMVAGVMFEYPQYWWDIFTANYKTSESFVLGFLTPIRWSRSIEEYTVVQITSLLAPFGLMNFYATSILMAALSYTGVWQLFLLFREKFPNSEKGIAIAVLFFPTVVFWGSGIMKDTIVFSCLGLLLYNINKLFNHGFFQPKNLAISALSVFLILSIKPYIIFSLAPGLVIWRSFRLKEKIRSGIIRKMLLPLIVVIGFVGSIYAIDFLGRFNENYTLNNFVASAQSMQDWHYQEGNNTSAQFGRGSSYSLGEYEPTPLGILKKFPAAVNVTLFRPYVWESNTFMQLLAAMESQLLFVFTLFVLLKVGIRKFFMRINDDSFLVLMFSFSLIFAFGVGFSAYNFGALARYKIPCIPFFVSLLVIIYQESQRERSEAYQRYLVEKREMESAIA